MHSGDWQVVNLDCSYLKFVENAELMFMFLCLPQTANTASLMAAVLWFFSYVPFMFMSEQYENLYLPAKISASLFSNSAMAFGFQLFLMYEGTGT
jgi:ATP-binding cassette subfamily A (ABC1) protein 3